MEIFSFRWSWMFLSASFKEIEYLEDLHYFLFVSILASWCAKKSCGSSLLPGGHFWGDFSGGHLWGESKSGFSLSQTRCLPPKVDDHMMKVFILISNGAQLLRGLGGAWKRRSLRVSKFSRHEARRGRSKVQRGQSCVGRLPPRSNKTSNSSWSAQM